MVNTTVFIMHRHELLMPAEIDKGTRQEIVYLRALDYDKQEIAEEVGVSRNTVRKHLQGVREEVEQSDAPKPKLASIIVDEQQLLAYALEQSSDALADARTLVDAFGGNSGSNGET